MVVITGKRSKPVDLMSISYQLVNLASRMVCGIKEYRVGGGT